MILKHVFKKQEPKAPYTYFLVTRKGLLHVFSCWKSALFCYWGLNLGP